MEKRIRVGCYGAKGSYTYEAMERHFGEREREEIFFPLFEDVMKAVAGGMIDYGVVPIENSSTGGITEVYDLIRGCGCAVVGEELVKIEHHLLGLSVSVFGSAEILLAEINGQVGVAQADRIGLYEHVVFPERGEFLLNELYFPAACDDS